MNKPSPKPYKRPSTTDAKKSRLKRKRLPRAFAETPIGAVGYQSGQERFRESEQRPNLHLWRNNLTALSQHHNLYFVAAGDVLQAYSPQYPSQRLSKSPIQIKLPNSHRNTSGHFGYSNAHSINHVIVSDLGDKEIVLCACDDGDVLAYWTSSILRSLEEQRAIIRAISRAGALNLDPIGLRHRTPEVEPFFHEHVHMSAWGLAVHKEARLIAVSSNSKKITIFAPALVEVESQDTRKQQRTHPELDVSHSYQGSGSIFYSQRRPRAGPDGTVQTELTPLLNDRVRSRRRTLHQHANNIPCIAFCNTPDDVDGILLASSDINGHTVVWDINTGLPVRRIYPMMNEDDGFQNSGWSVMFLDKRSFTRTSSVVESMGTCVSVSSGDRINPRDADMSLYDITESKPMVQSTGPWRAANRLFERTRNNTSENNNDMQDFDTGSESEEALIDPEFVTAQHPIPRYSGWGTVDVSGSSESSDSEDSTVNTMASSQTATDARQMRSPPSSRIPLLNSAPTFNHATSHFSLTHWSKSSRPDKSRITYLRNISNPTLYRNLAGKIPTEKIVCTDDQELNEMNSKRYPLLWYKSMRIESTFSQHSSETRSPCKVRVPSTPLLFTNPRAVHLFQDVEFNEFEDPNMKDLLWAVKNQRYDTDHFQIAPDMLIPPSAPNQMQERTSSADQSDRRRRPNQSSHQHQKSRPPNYKPVIFMSNPLQQETDPIISRFLHPHDRMNLTTQIPELGIVLLGSPKGRVALFTLHELAPDRKLPHQQQKHQEQRRSSGHTGSAQANNEYSKMNEFSEPAYTMRLDHILPFSGQEERGERPLDTLIGVSAGPVIANSTIPPPIVRETERRKRGRQRRGRPEEDTKMTNDWKEISFDQFNEKNAIGLETEIDEEKTHGAKEVKYNRKWRILLAYRDGSILAYEVGYPKTNSD